MKCLAEGGGEKQEGGGENCWCGLIPRPSGTPPHPAGLEGQRRALQPVPYRRRPLGQAKPAPALDHPLRQPDLPGGAHELQAHRPFSRSRRPTGTLPWSRSGARAGRSTCSTCLPIPAEQRWPARRRGPRCAMWTRPRAWWPGPGERPAVRPERCPPSAGSWMTAPSLWSGRSAGADATTP